MELYLARLDLSEMLDPSTVIAQDAHGEKDDAKKKAIELMQKKNRKAAGILLNSTDTKTPEGKATFRMIQIYHDKDNGYAGGQFAFTNTVIELVVRSVLE